MNEIKTDQNKKQKINEIRDLVKVKETFFNAATTKTTSINKSTENKNTIYATGKRKTAVAKIWITSNGSGTIKVNEKKLNQLLSKAGPSNDYQTTF